MPNHIAVMFNQAAGLGKRREELRWAVESMQQRGVDIRLEPLRHDQPWQEQIEARLAEGIDTLVAAGGDGTVNSIALYLLDTDCRLGVVPLGTCNHFAKHIGIPLDVTAALDIAIHGHTELIDVGEVNGVPFLNFSSIGLYADILTAFAARQRLGWPKRLALLRACVDILRPYAPLRVGFAKGSEGTEVQTPLVFVGNNRYALGGVDLLQACGDFRSGILQVAYIRDRGRFGLLRLLTSAFWRHGQLKQNLTMTGLRAFQIVSPYRRLRVAIDGEVRVMQPPLHYQVRPQALRVIVPPA